ncbi:MAG: DUF1499 domain-containing protein [Burkholderiales bacterium]|nr:DUF1499 domain-containing protein [Burkholderiales bacterium]
MKRKAASARARSAWGALPWLALAAAVAIAASGFGARFGAWDWRTGFAILRYASYAAFAIAAITIGALIVPHVRAGRARSLGVALAIALAASALPLFWMWQARTLPPINDISTDLANPPQFDKIAALRERAPVSVRYPGPETARLQRTGYPDLRTRVLRQPRDPVFDNALALARDMGWTIVATDPAKGIIEATATTFWFGFKDDVVIRVTRLNNDATRVDMRSVSRVGKGDLGANARRVRAYMSRLTP